MAGTNNFKNCRDKTTRHPLLGLFGNTEPFIMEYVDQDTGMQVLPGTAGSEKGTVLCVWGLEMSTTSDCLLSLPKVWPKEIIRDKRKGKDVYHSILCNSKNLKLTLMAKKWRKFSLKYGLSCPSLPKGFPYRPKEIPPKLNSV